MNNDVVNLRCAAARLHSTVLVSLAAGILAGCGGGGQPDATIDPAIRDLEDMGLVSDRGAEAFFGSLDELYGRMQEGDPEVAGLLARSGLMPFGGITDDESTRRQWGAGALLAYIPDAYYEIAADCVQFTETTVTREPDFSVGDWDPENPEHYKEVESVISSRPLPLYLAVPCIQNNIDVETNVDVIVQFIERPEGAREQFGVWVERDAPRLPGYLVITQAGGGAVICTATSSSDSFGRRYLPYSHDTYGGTFNDEGALNMTNNWSVLITAIVFERNGAEYMTFGGDTYSRVRTIGDAIGAMEGTEGCFR